MKKSHLALTLTVLFLITACSGNQSCPINGKWKSDEKLTLASMNETGKVTAKQRELFENDFFGKLEIEIKCKSFTTHLDGMSETYEYEIINQSKNTITTSYYNQTLQKQVEVTSKIDGNCYSIPIEHLKFSEYFCRTE